MNISGFFQSRGRPGRRGWEWHWVSQPGVSAADLAVNSRLPPVTAREEVQEHPFRVFHLQLKKLTLRKVEYLTQGYTKVVQS